MAFLYYSPVTINTGQVPTTQTDFPILINYTDNRFKTISNGGHVNSSSGFDIRPYSDSALTSALTYELEYYNGSTGQIIIWAKGSSVSDGLITYMAYGNPLLTSDGSSTSTWSNSFRNVYHFKDGTTLDVTDSTSSAMNLTNHGATATAGTIDGGASLVAASSQHIDKTNDAGLPNAVTMSAWMNGTTFPSTYNALMGWNHTAPTVQAMIWIKSNGKIFFNVWNGTASIGFDGTGSHTLSTGTTYYITMTYSSAAGLVGYVNAASDGTAAANGIISSSNTNFDVGNDPVTAGRFWNGWIDEVRVATVARSADWVTTEYNNQSAPSTFATLGTENSLSPIGCLFRI